VETHEKRLFSKDLEVQDVILLVCKNGLYNKKISNLPTIKILTIPTIKIINALGPLSRTWKAMKSNHFPHVFHKKRDLHF
jgi:hypothetical protein